MVGHIEVAAGAAGRALQQPGQQGQRARHAHEQLGIDRTGGGTATCTLPPGKQHTGESAGPEISNWARHLGRAGTHAALAGHPRLHCQHKTLQCSANHLQVPALVLQHVAQRRQPSIAERNLRLQALVLLQSRFGLWSC